MKTVLIVEDDSTTAESLRFILDGDKFSVRVANTLEQAQVEIDTTCPDIVLLDYWMGRNLPVSALVAHMRERCETLPALFLMSADPKAVVQADALGIPTFIQKPFDLNEIETILSA